MHFSISHNLLKQKKENDFLTQPNLNAPRPRTKNPILIDNDQSSQFPKKNLQPFKAQNPPKKTQKSGNRAHVSSAVRKQCNIVCAPSNTWARAAGARGHGGPAPGGIDTGAPRSPRPATAPPWPPPAPPRMPVPSEAVSVYGARPSNILTIGRVMRCCMVI